MAGHKNVIEFFISKGINVNDVATGNGWTSLHYAASAGELDAAKTLVEKGANIGAKNKDGKNPLDVANTYRKSKVVNFLGPKQSEYDRLLFAAVERGNVSEVTNLLNIGANIEARNAKNETPLCAASRIDKLDVLELLLSRNANVNVQDDDQRTPLHHAAYFGKGVELILGKGANIEAKDINHWTSLHYAAWQGQLEAAKLLLDYGAIIEAKTNLGEVPLHISAKFGRLDILRLLLIRSANIDAKNNDNETALKVANKFGQSNVADLLEKKKNEYGFLFNAIQNDDLNRVRGLLNEGANIESRDERDRTPLQYACWIGKLEIAKFLFDKGADIETRDSVYDTPLHDITYDTPREGFKDIDLKGITEFLLDRGADVNAKDKHGQTTLEAAKARNKLDMVKLLEGISINHTPLHYAAREGKLELIKFLLNKGFSIEARDKDDSTPLHYAARKGQLEAAKLLLDEGASIEAENKDGKTPLDIAIDQKHDNTVKYFKEFKEGRKEQPVQRKRRHHHGDHPRHHSGEQKYLQREERSIGPKGASRNIENINSAIEGNQQATSGASKPSSWINAFAHIVDAVKGVSQFISSPFKPAIDMEHSQPSKAMTTQGVDANGTLLLLDVFIRKITGQKYISTADQPTISLPEAECHASDIINGFEKVLKETAVKSGISVTNLNFDPIKLQSDIVGQLINGKFSEISKTLYSSVKQACPEFKQTKRFLSRLETCIEEFLDKKELSSIGQNLKLKKQICKQELCSSANFMTDNPTIASLANVSRSESQLPGKTDDKPRTCLNDPTVDKQLQRSL
ncbi:ankyrin repeat domain-containing protein [Wolbachia endosymbiont (group A) of Agelastica alni]|uniref:ankyrin repeat domain-containing protein n=1 Tax=Wolbachia endosymbiont (group A) of Agelastica alni TaxID=3066130 RepID=UPI0031334AE5